MLGLDWDVTSNPYSYGWDVERQEFPDATDPYGGGFRHCVSACESGKAGYGELAVSVWDFVMEDSGDPGSVADMNAEQQGLECARRKGSCRDQCLGLFPSPDPSDPMRVNPR